ncbi:MAG: hypothetical protein Q9216_003431 [Gyalolechia sp. 2 TL-2023]
MEASENPLLKALPPAVDYLSYLTILEYNLTSEQLPVLHGLLQDTTFTANVGWDLVHLLLPLLPESRTCLQDVARLGNPREVVLKVTELLEELARADEVDDVGEEAEGNSSEPEQTTNTSTEAPSDEVPSCHEDDAPLVPPIHKSHDQPLKPPSRVSQFCVLVDMLAVLHPRIKTKHPSRFLSTSLQPLLSAYASLLTHDEATDATLDFIQTFAGTKRPKLPPRKSSMQVLTQPQGICDAAPDPEAKDEPVAPEEHDLQQRLIQSFLTFVVEGYLSSLPAGDDIVAMCWSTRLRQQSHPEKKIPGKDSACEAFKKDERLHRQDVILGQMLVRRALPQRSKKCSNCQALARDLNLAPEELATTLVEPEDVINDDSDDLPSSASEIPLSRPGCLYLLCATIASKVFFHAPSSIPHLSSFPIYSTILRNSLTPEQLTGSIGPESLALIDSLLFLESYISEIPGFGSSLPDDKIFNSHLQYLSLLSANTPSRILRYNAHVLATRVFHAHPSDDRRFSIIKDNLEHCPYENLKASAIGWLKDEIVNARRLEPPTSHQSLRIGDGTKSGTTPFKEAHCMSIMAPFVFLCPTDMTDDAFLSHQNYFLTVLNLYYLLLTMGGPGEHPRDSGGVDYHFNHDWLTEMDYRIKKFREENAGEGAAGMGLMEGLIEMCRDKLTS